MDWFTEPERQIPVDGEYAVAVVGGGIAGVAAALAAARNGARTLLIEKQYQPGGLATAGLVTIYLPLCDGRGHQVSFGLAEELLRESVHYGYEDEGWYPRAWLEHGTQAQRAEGRYQLRFNAGAAAIRMEQLLRQAGVEILYGTTVCAAHVRDGRVDILVTENSSGRRALRVSSVVDATGDAVLAHLAGAPTALYGAGNILAGWYFYADGAGFHTQMLGASDVPDEDGTIPEEPDHAHWGGLDAREVSAMVQASHKVTLRHFLRRGAVTPDHVLTAIASTPQIRMTRRLDGELTPDDREGISYPDSIGLCGDWRHRGPVFELPLRALYNGKVRNLTVAGRCISVTDAMWDITRVIPVCAVTGQAAGTAAAMSDDLSRLDVGALQQRLRETGVRFHREEIPGL